MYHFNGEVLNGCAFIDVDFYAVTMSSLKNFLVIGDLCKSVTLVYWDVCISYVLAIILRVF